MPSGCVEYRYSHIARLNAARVYGRSIKVWMEDLREVLAYMLEWVRSLVQATGSCQHTNMKYLSIIALCKRIIAYPETSAKSPTNSYIS